jgi:hypothetical protein
MAGTFEAPKSGSSLIPPPVGFAALRARSGSSGSYGSMQPLVGFAAGLAVPKGRPESGAGRSTVPNSEHVAEKAARRKLRSAGREPSGVWPAMRIVRPIFRHDADWIRFHKDYEEGTTGTGEVPSLGKWCVEYVTKHELDTMLDKRYKEIARTKDKGRASRTGRGILGEIEKFVHKQLRDRNQAELLELGEDRALRFEGSQPELGALSVEAVLAERPRTANIWERGAFEVTHTEGFGTNEIGLLFDREARRTFRKERAAVIDFIGSGSGLDLDPSVMASNWEPHVTILNTYLPVGEISNLEEPPMPLYMELRPPQVCLVNPKMV